MCYSPHGGAENCISPERYPEFEGNFDMSKQGHPGDLTVAERDAIVRRLGFHYRTTPEEYEANLRIILRKLKQRADTVAGCIRRNLKKGTPTR